MQADTQRVITGRSDSEHESAPTITPCKPALHQVFSAQWCAAISSITCFTRRLQTQGWLVKAPEFINSGPPALLNNPCCSRRVDFYSFLKHAMEVQHG